MTANGKMLGHFENFVMSEKQPFLVRCSDTPLVLANTLPKTVVCAGYLRHDGNFEVAYYPNPGV
jgi:hypothetical protein